MTRASKTSASRFSISLDSSIALEALINHRLIELAKPRRHDWLRSLLIKGFCAECAEIRQLQRESQTSTKSSYVPAEFIDTPQQITPTVERNAAATVAKTANSTEHTTKPTSLSALKAVMG